MAFHREQFSSFQRFLREIGNDPFLAQAIKSNFFLEERLSEAREESYSSSLQENPVLFEEWGFQHDEYLMSNINVFPEDTPETFQEKNQANCLPQVDPNQYLVRLERARWPAEISGYPVEQLFENHFNTFLYDPDQAKREAEKLFLSDFFEKWNQIRDARPLFCSTWGEVKSLFEQDPPKSGKNTAWPNRLRDRLGLGHFDPVNEGPIPVLLLRFRVSETEQKESRGVAVPTVLDGKHNPFFSPTPVTTQEGQTLDLSPGGENEYELTCEVLSPYVTYQPEHLYGFGWIDQPLGKSCEKARKIHLQYLDGFHHFEDFQRIFAL